MTGPPINCESNTLLFAVLAIQSDLILSPNRIHLTSNIHKHHRRNRTVSTFATPSMPDYWAKVYFNTNFNH
jgi:hypothetical protein